jgi:hypothetical protein
LFSGKIIIPYEWEVQTTFFTAGNSEKENERVRWRWDGEGRGGRKIVGIRTIMEYIVW